MAFSEITPENIKILVDTFYGKIRKDDFLGPIFDEKIGDRWDQHLPKMYAFWANVMLKTGGYDGRPVPPHVGIKGISRDHFSHWLDLFHATARELYEPDQAEQFVNRSNLIAESLQIAIFRILGQEGGFVAKPWTPADNG
ncbi:group III truncated hemoglobin [Emcibacter sp.]|uniref:group III truncated hemoglobin n=1 Tax=Emcibacter sp. TaxID=1979954 RepID=UPI002AA6B5E2|nr:group III truncated hemoglobin [Emcibacter sp.]